MPAPTSGVIEELLIADGERVEAGNELFKIRVSGKDFCVKLFYV